MALLRSFPTASLGLLLLLTWSPVQAGNREAKTMEAAAATVRDLAAIPLRGIPQSLLHHAAGVAVIPHATKTALLVDWEFGQGVMLVHEGDGRWSNPVFITLKGFGVGAEAGLEKTDLVLVFKTRKSLDRALRGKLTLGGDVAVSAGPLGRETEVGSDRKLKAEVFSYSRSRGLFVGLTVEGTHLSVDKKANEAFYHLPGGNAPDVLAFHSIPSRPWWPRSRRN